MMKTLMAVLAWAIPAAAIAAPPVADPDWPCQQRLVPQITAATLWHGAEPPAGADWQADPRIKRLVEAVAPRDVPVDEGKTTIAAFVHALKPAERPKMTAEAFVGIVDHTNMERGEIIDRIKSLTRRQRQVADTVAKLSTDVNAIPADAQGDDGVRRADTVRQRDLVLRAFNETERTMRYACDVPTQLDARLGQYAAALSP